MDSCEIVGRRRPNAELAHMMSGTKYFWAESKDEVIREEPPL